MKEELPVAVQIAALAIQIGVILFAARFCGTAAQKLKVPSVLGELLAGIVIGPYVLGSIGLPFPDTYIKIVKPGTDEELPYGEEGEILLAGPTVMKEYLNNPEETAQTLRKHADGMTWVYTGDLGYMDDDGFIFFRGRAMSPGYIDSFCSRAII